MTARIEHLVTSGTFSLDGQTFDVDNNVWLLGDDDEVIVFDAPHDPDAIEAAVGDRTVVAGGALSSSDRMAAQRGKDHRGGVRGYRLEPWLGAPDSPPLQRAGSGGSGRPPAW